MEEGASSAARGWLHCALAGAASSGLLALADGWLQPGAAAPLLRWPVMAFTVLGAWMLVALALALSWPLLRDEPPRPHTGFAFGCFAGSAPWLHALIPEVEGSVAVALAHLSSVALSLIVFAKVRPGPSLRLSARLAAIPGAVLLVGLLWPHRLPDLRSADARADAASLPSSRPAAPAGAPDLILISVDTLRADAVFADPARPGVPSAPTPFLQSLREGRALWAPWALSSSDQTLPGHVGMLAGMDAFAHGVRDNTEAPAPELRFLAQELRGAGYRTAATISNALIGRVTGMDRGYDEFSERPVELATFGMLMLPWLDHHSWLGRCMPERWTGRLFALGFYRRLFREAGVALGERTLEAATAQLEQLQRGEGPFFHFVHFMDPHTDYAPPPAWRGRLSGGAAEGLPAAMVPDERAILHGGHLDAIEQGLAGPDAETARRAAAYCHLVYLEEVMFVDDCLRRYVAAAEASGRPTVFLLTADHGEMFGEHGRMEHANGLWEENLRVPLMVWGANVPPGELGWIPGLQDVAPTLLTLAGLGVPPEMVGAPLLLPADGGIPNGARAPAALAPAPAPQRSGVAAQTTEAAVRRGALKWTGAWDEDGGDPATVRVVDLATDPFERAPAAAAPPDLMAVVASELERDTWPKRVRVAVSDALSAMLRGLGYAGD